MLVGANVLGGHGGAYLVDGDDVGTVSAAAAIARFDSETAVDFAGDEVSWLGDVDGDGVDDFAVGAPTRDENGEQSGTVYVVRGLVQGTWSLGDTDAS